MNHRLKIFYLVTVDAQVFMAQNEYIFSEGLIPLFTLVCVEILTPAEGLEINLLATLNVTDGFKAGTSYTFMSSVCDISY